MKKSKKTAKKESPQASKKAVPAKKTKKVSKFAAKAKTSKKKTPKKRLKSQMQAPPADTVVAGGSSAEAIDNSGVVTQPGGQQAPSGALTVNAVICKKCGDTVYSRAQHDMRWCSCSSISIDGGFDYTKVSGNPGDFEQTTVRVRATIEELYRDWNNGDDKFGLIKGKKLQSSTQAVAQ